MATEPACEARLTILPDFLGDHAPADRLRHQEAAREIDVERALPGGEADAFGRREIDDAGAIDEDVDAAHLRHHCGDDGLDVFRVSDVAGPRR